MACAATASADVFLAEGVNLNDIESSDRFYDGGKGRDWDRFEQAAYKIYTDAGKDLSIFGGLASSIVVPNNQSRLDCSALYNDSGHCWAYTSSNMLQYWQTYYGVFSKKVGETKAAPVHGYNYDHGYMVNLGGTQSLKLNKLFYDNFDGSSEKGGGSTIKAFGWYLQGENDWSGQLDKTSAPGYFSKYFAHYNDTHTTINGQNLSSLAAMSDSIKQAFGYTQQNGEWVQTTKGQIMHLELKSANYSHAITCYGFETDADGNIKALYVVNSDDRKYELIKVYTKFSNYGTYDYRLELHYDEECSGYNSYNAWAVTGWSSVNTPDVLKNMLAEYEKGNLVWMGKLESWTDTSAKADVNVLPDDTTGWMKYAGTGTQHAGYYNSYYSADSSVEFNDAASSGAVTVGADMSVPSMLVNNSEKAYSFSGENVTITTDSFTKEGAGSVVFDGVKLVAGSAVLKGDVTFDELHVTGTLDAAGKNIMAKSVTLDGNATIGSIGSDAGENSIGDTTALTITGGTTNIQNTGWTGLKSLALSDQARLYVSASLNIGGDITTCETATGSLADGVTAGLETKYCTKVDGDVTLTGDLKAGAYIKIGGDANVTGNVIASGDGGDRSISIGGKANISGDITTDQGITLAQGGNVNGNVSGSSLTIGGDASFGSIGNSGMALTVNGGRTTVRNEGAWTEVKSLAISDQGSLKVGASLKVTGDVTTSPTAIGTLAANTPRGIETRYCTEVGGDVTLTGDIKAGAYVKIGGDANVTGNVIVSGDGGDRSISIGGKANVSGNISTDHNVTLSQGGEVKGGVKTAGTVTVGGDLANTAIEAKSVTFAAVEGSVFTLEAVKVTLTDGELKLSDAVVKGASSFASTSGMLKMTVENVTFTFDETNSWLTGAERPQLLSVGGPVLTAAENASQLMNFEISSDMLQGVDVSGELTFDLSHWKEAIQEGGYSAVTLNFDAGTAITEDTKVKATFDGVNFAEADLTAGSNQAQIGLAGLPGIDQPALGIPEPTTATLSLLALAALAARRRRK